MFMHLLMVIVIYCVGLGWNIHEAIQVELYAAGCWGATTEAVSLAEILTSSARMVEPRPDPHSLTKSVNI
jgi:hypothetical protein